MKSYTANENRIGSAVSEILRQRHTEILLLYYFLFEYSFIKFSVYDPIHDYLVWLRSGSYPADIDRFRSHTG